MSHRLEWCLLALITAACAKQEDQQAQPVQPAADLRYVGSSTVGQGAMPELVTVFKQRTGIKVSKGPPQGNAKAFFDFVLSPEGQAIVGRNFVPRSIPKG